MCKFPTAIAAQAAESGETAACLPTQPAHHVLHVIVHRNEVTLVEVGGTQSDFVSFAAPARSSGFDWALYKTRSYRDEVCTCCVGQVFA